MRVALNHKMWYGLNGSCGKGEWMSESEKEIERWDEDEDDKESESEKKRSQNNHHRRSSLFSAYEISTEKYLLDFFVFPTLVSVFIYRHIYMCVCVCFCVAVRACVHSILFSPFLLCYAPRIHFLYPTSITLITHIFFAWFILNLCHCIHIRYLCK